MVFTVGDPNRVLCRKTPEATAFARPAFSLKYDCPVFMRPGKGACRFCDGVPPQNMVVVSTVGCFRALKLTKVVLINNDILTPEQPVPQLCGTSDVVPVHASRQRWTRNGT